MITAEQIQKARSKFLASRLWQGTADTGDDAPIKIVVGAKNGYTLHMTLGDLRALKANLSNDAERLRKENAFLREWLRGELTIADADIDQELERHAHP